MQDGHHLGILQRNLNNIHAHKNDASLNWCGVNLIKVISLLNTVNEKLDSYVYVSFTQWNTSSSTDMPLPTLLSLLTECYRVSDSSQW